MTVHSLALSAGSAQAFISYAHRRLQLLIDGTTGHVGESKRFGVRKSEVGDEDLTGDLQLGASLVKLSQWS